FNFASIRLFHGKTAFAHTTNLWAGESCFSMKLTADLSTALRFGRDDKFVGRGKLFFHETETAGLSTTLRCGRDDKFVGRGKLFFHEANRRSLHYAMLRSRRQICGRGKAVFP
ncbi:MAG: hypothetical protein WA510_22700, partial [Acidobacteriaceae bacterium]